jgi:hypothetical protein
MLKFKNCFLPSEFIIRYSTCPLRPQAGLSWNSHTYDRQGHLQAAKPLAGQAGILRFAFRLLRNYEKTENSPAKSLFLPFDKVSADLPAQRPFWKRSPEPQW